ncbi:hypothetical protein CONLIGDRAFT_685409 [Coniochaeta ligniaria NRRL 30616]|uniref:Uncharacterized protein n=1 Tax=Coniochaeta ligniaria NRRL 30616 TaxID=1408157 RepID=A0A1J7I9S6_9PEZI|nr:hypothetical protein CONLIGDRAFT_685409 [Coniochaeta ligniaria NRRL 30616]
MSGVIYNTDEEEEPAASKPLLQVSYTKKTAPIQNPRRLQTMNTEQPAPQHGMSYGHQDLERGQPITDYSNSCCHCETDGRGRYQCGFSNCNAADITCGFIGLGSLFILMFGLAYIFTHLPPKHGKEE